MRLFTAKTALYSAAAYGALLTAGLLGAAIERRDEPLSSGIAGIIGGASCLAFYLGLGIFARRLVQARAKRKWFAACAFASFAVGVMGGGPSGLIAFAPPTLVLIVLAIRG